MTTMRRFAGITYGGDGRPLTATDWRAQRHLDEREGILCGRGCTTCEWVRKWAAQQARLRGNVLQSPR